MSLELYLIAEDSSSETLVSPSFLTEIGNDFVQIGREPSAADGITVESKTVSRVHGVFQKLNGHWFFKDLGSSNGSWLNGKHLPAAQYFLLRSGDELQLADTFLGLLIKNEEAPPASVLVFNRGDLQSEVVAPDNGKFLSIGGAKSDFKLDVDLGSLPQFIVERRPDILCVYPISSEYRATVNGATLDHLIQLQDCDYIELVPYLLIVNLPVVQSLEADSIGSRSNIGALASWEEAEKAPKSHLFGRSRAESGESAEDLAEVVNPKKNLRMKLDSVEEKLVAALGFLLVLSILAAVLWWFLR